MNSHKLQPAGFSTIALLVVLGAAAIIGFGLFFATQLNSNTSPIASMTKNSVGNVIPSEALTNRELNTTIPDIVGRGQNLECDWRMPVEGENPFNKGTLWTTTNKGRSTITATIGGMEAEGNAIYMNNTAYSWMILGGQKIGMKFTEATLNEANKSLSPQEKQQAEQIRQNMIFNCKPWNPDETKFILPSDITFEEK